MEGAIEHVCSERDDLRLKLQASEDALLQFKAEAEIAHRLAKVWEEDKERLINDLRVQQEELELVRERFRIVEQNRSANREESTKDQTSLPQMTVLASSGSKRPLDDDHTEPSTSKRPRMTADENGDQREEKFDADGDDDDLGETTNGGPSVTPEIIASLARYLSRDPMEISPTPSCPRIPTAFLRETYETVPQRTFHLIPSHKNPTSENQPLERRIAWPKSVKSPLMPRLPGHPGILSTSMYEGIPSGPISLVFVAPCAQRRDEPGTHLGEYEMQVIGQMTPQWFSMQNDKTKKYWAGSLLWRGSDDCVRLRSRVALRKHGVIQGEDQEKDDKEVEKECEAVKAGGGYPITGQDIIRAFNCGHERPPIYLTQVTCVGYDHTFADDIKAKWPAYQAAALEAKRLEKEAVANGDEKDDAPSVAIVEAPAKKKRKKKGKGKAKTEEATGMTMETPSIDNAASSSSHEGATLLHTQVNIVEEGIEEGEVAE
ncbi:hypothetical protein BKA70DRAFT_1527902 [Coprinopsis sp. MPI-PUGE-AT-0042]|nr:hypothetical protein BKA70DRAFT_1527902 [Coprinopsis sp. MPI-PUGE-AT-0042]